MIFNRLLILNLFMVSVAQGAILEQKQLSMGLVSENRQESLSIRDSKKTKEIRYKPNLGGAIGLLVSYDWLSLTVMTSKALPPKEEGMKGDSTYDDIRGGGFFGEQKQYYLFGGYARYNGFYIENSRDLDPSLPANQYYTYDLELKKFEAMLTYVFSPENYSMAAAQTQLTRQTESGGSWKVKAVAEHLQIKNGSKAIIPANIQGQFGAQAEFQGGEFTTLGVMGGYAYTLVLWESWFAHLSMMLGPGFGTNRYYYASSASTETQMNFVSDVGANFGFNGESIFASINIKTHANEFSTGSLVNSAQSMMANLTLGYRF